MISTLLPIAITLIPFLAILLLIYLFLGKKIAKKSALIFGALLLALAVVAFGVALTFPSNKTSVTIAGEEVASRVIGQEYPGIKYSVKGHVVTQQDQTFNEYRIKLATNFDKTAYQKLNKDVCEHLGDKTAHIITSSTTSDLNPLRGVSGTCTDGFK